MADSHLVSTAIARLSTLGALGPRRLQGIWLFGSRARATATAASDLDLGVLCEPGLELDRYRWMDELGRALALDVDVIDLRTTSPILAWEVLTTGRCVFEPDSVAVEDFVRRTRFAAEDAEQRDRMILLAQIEETSGLTVRPAVVRARLAHLGFVLEQLERLRLLADDARRSEPLHRMAAERGIHVAADAIFDIGHHVLARRALPVPAAHRDVVPALASAGVLRPRLAARLTGMAGLRNILVHDYVAVDPDRVWQVLDHHLADLRAVRQALGTLPELIGPSTVS